MTSDDLKGVVQFLRSAERLKATYRSAWTSNGDRESVAAHTWRLCLMALVLADDYPDIDAGRLIRILIVHDLGEALHGDIPAPRQDPSSGKAEQERRDLLELLAPLPGKLREEITRLWDEYDDAATPEARLAKGLDKLETIMQHNQGRNPAGFDYAFNLGYGRAFTADDHHLAALRALLDAETVRRGQGSARGARAVPAPVGNYELARLAPAGGRWLLISGQIPETADGTIPPEFEAQCRLVWQHILACLDEAGLGPQDLVKVTTFLTRREDADLNSTIRQEVLGAHRPALTVVLVQTLDPRWLLEIEAVAAGQELPHGS